MAALSTIGNVSVYFVGEASDVELSEARKFCSIFGGRLISVPAAPSLPKLKATFLLLLRSLSPAAEWLSTKRPSEEIAQALRIADVTWVYSTQVFDRLRMPAGGQIVLDVNDLEENVISPGRSLGKALLTRSKKHSRARQMRAASVSLVCSEIDRDRIRARTSVEILHNTYLNGTIENGFMPLTLSDEIRTQSTSRVVFIGKMTYGPNSDGARWLLSEVWPRVLEINPEFRLDLIGRGSEELAKFRSMPSVVGHGEVSTVSELLKSAQMSLVPILYGSGTRVKILESFALGVPVVSTSIGAEGLSVQDGVHLLIADSPEEFATAIARLAADQILARQLSAHTFRLFDEQYSFRRFSESIKRIALEVLERH